MLARKANESLLNGFENGAQNKLELQSNKSTSQDASQSMGSEIKDIIRSHRAAIKQPSWGLARASS